MNPDRWGQIKQIYHSALELEPGHREEFLKEACAGDASLLKEVTSLLAQDRSPYRLFESPALDVVAQALGEAREEQCLNFVGRTFSHYRIVEKIGEGGMGVVYRAEDTRLRRSVAIKLLPPGRVSDPQRKRRFVKEARAASALNHPNIVTIYDIDQAEGIDFIAMEYLAGKTLDRRIPHRGMPIGKVLEIGVQIAGALAAAHSAGIIHRDLKPSNVMVGDNGQVKILDFGLVKLIERAEVNALENPPANWQESTVGSTEEGTILGTVGYMSPEQVEGKPVDRRSDIFSLGAVLYEMVTGQRAFRGHSPVSTLAAILREEPRLVRSLASDVPPQLERVIFRCLRKDPNRRFQLADELKIGLEDVKGELDSDGQGATAPVARRRRWLPWAAIGTAAVAAILAVALWLALPFFSRTEPSSGLIPVTAFPGAETTPCFSPDGNQVTFAWDGEDQQNRDIYVKMLGSQGLSRLTTHPGLDASPVWSPDGRWIAFCRFSPPPDSNHFWLVVIPAIGGPERVLWEGPVPPREQPDTEDVLCWSPDGKWVVGPYFKPPEQPTIAFFSTETAGEIRPIPASVFSPGFPATPSLSPDQKSLLFGRETGDNPNAHISILPLSPDLRPTGSVRALGLNGGSPVWTPDGLSVVYNADSSLRFCLLTVPVTGGPPVRLNAAGDYAACPSISSDGKRVVFEKWSSWDPDLYRLALDNGMTTNGSSIRFLSSTRNDFDPAYSPDGSQIAFCSDRSGGIGIWVAEADGSNARERFARKDWAPYHPEWSPDGRQLVFVFKGPGQHDIYKVFAQGGTPARLTFDPIDELTPSWSRDGRWIYFSSSKTGRMEVWKIPAEGGEAVQVTRDGGYAPRESPNGDWLYYVGSHRHHATLWRTKTTRGEAEKVLPSVYSGRFSLVNDGVYFVTSVGGSKFELGFKAFKNGKITTLERMTAWSMGRLAVSPDQKSIVFRQVKDVNVDIMMIENFR